MTENRHDISVPDFIKKNATRGLENLEFAGNGLTDKTKREARLMASGEISHDKTTRFLSEDDYTSKDLWLQVKPTVRKVESGEGVVIFDDTVQEKPYTDENEVMCWHYDHSKGRSVQGFHLLNCLYYIDDISIPVAFELIKKPVQYSNLKTKKCKRKSLVTKNELMRQMLDVCVANKLKFRFVLFDIWFSSAENMRYIKKAHEKDFVCAVKGNRLVTLSKEDQSVKRFVRIDELDWSEEKIHTAWFKDVPFPVNLVRQVFENKDGSTSILYLACSDTTMERDAIETVYKKRWPIEIFHKSLKQNAALGKVPVRINHFALRSKIYLKALKSAYEELQVIKAA